AANPNNFVAINLKGEVLLTQQRYEEAEKEFQKAIEVQPKWPVPYRGYALARFRQKDHDGGIGIYEQGIAATNHAVMLVTDLATYFEQTGQIDRAIAVYENALAATPDV